jgi:hypothetical protein
MKVQAASKSDLWRKLQLKALTFFESDTLQPSEELVGLQNDPNVTGPGDRAPGS